VPPPQVYDAWLDSERPPRIAGGEVSADVGGEFTAGNGYISGKNLGLETGKRILQSWRTQNSEALDAASELEIILEAVLEGTKLTLKHTNIPDAGAGYKDGWVEHYFEPMKTYFQG